MAWTESARKKALQSKRLNGNTNQYTKAKQENRPIPESKLKGKPKNNWKPHTEKTKQILREKALTSPHRRLIRSIRSYIKSDGSTVLLDSSWEELLANRLDKLQIKWIRPKPITWTDTKNQQRNYFPDFYLPEYDLYLDPKNPEAFRQQKEKINWLTQNVHNLIFLCSKEEIENYLPVSARSSKS